MNTFLIFALGLLCVTSVFATYGKAYYGGHGHLGGAHYYRRPVHYGGHGHVAYAKPVVRHATYVKPVVHHSTYVKPVVHHAPVVHRAKSSSYYHKAVPAHGYYAGPSYHHGSHAAVYKSKYSHHG